MNNVFSYLIILFNDVVLFILGCLEFEIDIWIELIIKKKRKIFIEYF